MGDVHRQILVVEDQADVRLMLVAALEMEGYSVVAAADALEGLACLREQRFRLILTDYAMPGGTGAWMLHQANREDILHGAAAMIVTAQPDLKGIEGVDVIEKPLDLEAFLDQVSRIVRDGSTPAAASASATVELVLYVSGASPASLRARRALDGILGQFDRSRVQLSILDLSREPLAGEADHVVFTPTLVKRAPGPVMWVLGNLREPGMVEDLLRACGVPAAGERPRYH